MSTDGSLEDASAAAEPAAWAHADAADPHPDPPQPDPIPPTPPEPAQGQAMGTLLEPVLHRACDNRLSQVNWFRTDWQRGGAVTGYASFDRPSLGPQPVVVKLPVPPCERRWLLALQPSNPCDQSVVPHIHAHGQSLNGYDLAWLVMEHLPHGPLGNAWGPQAFDLLADAAARFYAAAEQLPIDDPPPEKDWAQILQRARKAVRPRQFPDAQRWNAALKKAQKKLNAWLAQWADRPCEHWCHGDLHLGNAMTRQPDGPAVLIDFARTRPGHWIEDAVYFEHIYWGREDRLDGRKICKLIAHRRKAHDLPVNPDWPELAHVKRTLLAISAPLRNLADADARHMAAALQILERAVA